LKNNKIRFISLDTQKVKKFKRVHDLMVLGMLASDLLGILAAVALASLVRGMLVSDPLAPGSYVWWLPMYLTVFILSAALRGLYPAVGMSIVEQFRNLTIATSILFLVIMGGTFFFKVSENFSRLLLGLSWLFCLIIIPFNRTIVRHWMAKAGLWGEPVAVLGCAAEATRVVSYFKCYPKIGLCPKVMITIPDKIADLDVDTCVRLKPRLIRLKNSTHIKTVVVSYDKLENTTSIREICSTIFEKVILIADNDSKINLCGMNVRQYGNLFTFEIHHLLLDRSAQFQKRAMDICIAGLMLLLLSPLLALISVLIVLESSGGVFYRQRRLGKGGQEFGMLKFRTMCQDADAVLHTYLMQNPARQHEWDQYQKLQNDPRITRIGYLLRRLSLDELPQLWNVLIGEMSMVGPRPIMLNQRDLYGENYQYYIRVVPGISGLWQISGRNHTTFADRTKFDMEYVSNWSIWEDIHIIIRTAWILLRRDGAY
jgi:Undecaprenyl-phosphate galactose phosphotransferase WbaP